MPPVTVGFAVERTVRWRPDLFTTELRGGRAAMGVIGSVSVAAAEPTFMLDPGAISGMQVYFAAPLFCMSELQFNEDVAGLLEEAGHDVFLPQRDGMESTDLEDYDDIETTEEMMDAIFDLDQRQVGEADVLTAVLDGRTVDEGVALEIGMAYARGIPVIGLRTDRRAFGIDEPVNAMVWGACEEIVDHPADLVDAVAQHE